jgi:uncharacterized oligopeptide transporter (OPT) family protein
MAVNSVLGVLIAFPLKRRFVNDEQQPFPEGRACAVVLDALYPDAPPGGSAPAEVVVATPEAHRNARRQARSLFGAAGISALVSFLQLEGWQTLLQSKLLGLSRVIRLPEHLLGWWDPLAARFGWGPLRILGTELGQLGINPVLDLTMFGAGGLSGLRTASSMLVGCVVNWFVLAPLMIRLGEIPPDDHGHFGRAWLLNTWCLWWGVGIMVSGSLTALVARPELILASFRGLGKRAAAVDPVAHVELPLWVSVVGVPVVSVVAVGLNAAWFHLNPVLVLASIPLTAVLTLIAANATALTGTTPTGSLSKITQFTFGALDRTNPATNLVTAGITSEAASNAANLLMDIKPGYMLGAKPRQQAVGHLIGIVSGGIASTVLFFPLFLPHPEAGRPLYEQLVTDKFPMPGLELWRGVALLVASGGHDLRTSALVALGVAVAVGAVFEVAKTWSHGKFPLSPVAIGLGVVVPVDSTLMIFAGALFFAAMNRRYRSAPRGTLARSLWVDSTEPVAAGIVAGAALTGIGDQLISVFLLG